MAASATVQSIPATSVTRNAAANGNRHRYCFASLPSLRRGPTTASTLRVRCAAKENPDREVGDQTPITPPPPPPPAPKPKVSTKFSDVLAFGGPAPERINGRLAMVGFVAAVAVELAKGQDLFAQISDGGVAWFVGTSVVLSLASLVPLFKGVSVQSQSGGVMSSDAELWNGRLAMVGLVALAFTEYVKGGALV